MKELKKGTIMKVSGPLVVAENMEGSKVYEVVSVGDDGLLGEVIEIRREKVFIQVYEDTSGVGPGEPVTRTGEQLSAILGPGLLGSIFDGVGRPLRSIEEASGHFIKRGVSVPSLDENKKWKFTPFVKEGDLISAGDILGEVQETELISHKIMVPPESKGGKISSILEGDFNIKEIIARTANEQYSMMQSWPIRESRPVKTKLLPSLPLITGQRVIDAFFPVAKGGTACIPGPFGSGKTVIQHCIAKWSDADIVIFVGCGERGNEMTDVLQEFPELKDPRTGRPLMERTVLIANTSNMPVAAREASVYTGVTIAEYFRDMGYDVALMADSTSRWAEALREMSARLEEMPGEEGYPAYLGSRTASFYERSGSVECLSSKKREGSLTVIGSVSPPGGDLSEPVTQNTLRTTKVFWSLEDRLANARHFPAINWLRSYSLYTEDLSSYFSENMGEKFGMDRNEAMRILSEEEKLEEIVRLVGFEALSSKDKLIMDVSRIIREDFLMQNAFDDIDTYSSMKKQAAMIGHIIDYHKKGLSIISEGKDIENFFSLPERKNLARMKLQSEEELGNKH